MQGDVEPMGGGGGTLQGPTESAGGLPFALSIIPSQSLSSPSQVSTFGSIWPTQTSVPFWHCCAPYAHGKTLLMPQDFPASVGLSSTTPSQSSSLLLHSSA